MRALVGNFRRVLFVLAWGGLFGGIVYLSFDVALGFDEAYNLNLALTLAAHSRYATHLADGFRHFDPAVSTGPHLLLWLGLWFKLAAATFRNVRVFMGGIFLISMLLIYKGTQVWAGRAVAFATVAVFLLLPYVFLWGVSAQGDVWAVGWVFLSLYFLKKSVDAVAQARRWIWAVAGGVSLGLAVLTKTIVVLLLPAFAVSAVASGRQRHSWMQAGQEGMIPAVAAMMLAGWQIFQYGILQRFASLETFVRWRQLSRARYHLVWRVVIFDPFSHPRGAFLSSLHEFGPFIILIILWGVAVAWQRQNGYRLFGAHSQFERIAALGAASEFAWFYALSGEQANNRHVLLGYTFIVVLGVRALRALFPTRLSAAAKWRILGAGAFAFLLGWGMFTGLDAGRQVLRFGRVHLTDQRVVAAWVSEHVAADEPLSGLGWFAPWDIAFLTGRLPAQADLYADPPQGVTRWFILTPEVRATGSMTELARQRLDSLGRLAFQRDGYEVYEMLQGR